MQHLKLYQKGKIVFLFFAVTAILTAACGRLAYLMIVQSDYYGKKAQALHERERSIKAARGKIVDRNGIVLADNRSVCTVSVIHSQIRDPERVIAELAELLELPEDTVRKRVEKVSSIERISSNVPKETGDAILARQLEGVKVDEDYRRYYPYDSLASKVIGFTGGDNQGIVGLEVRYDDWLSGEDGKILTMTNAYGQELEQEGERRQEPVTGNQLTISMDCNLQMYCEQAAQKVMLEKNADEVSVILMNPQNGEIFAMVNVPEYNLNEPFTLNVEPASDLKESEKQDLLNQMWRNACINDTYEPGSTFKIITTAAALEQGVVTVNDSFYCPGYKIVEDRRIRCHKTTGHGAETFTQGIMNSCNPVFIELGLRLGAENFYHYFEQFGLLRKTGIDLPGEAATIMHKKENIGQVELATISFGQSFQITPIQLVTTVSSLINGGTRVVPHFGVSVQNAEGETRKTFSYDETEGTVSTATSKTLCDLLEHVVSEGTGKKAAIEGFSIGGKTATSQTLPRSDHKYIASFLGFAPAEDPQVIGLIVIDNPQGVYYGGTVAAPVMKEIFENALPYLGIGKTVTEQMQQEEIAAGSR
ncbi:peptidoglycan D,D-transpeptidase FtsI family protein [Eubacterium ramulus]|jgi:stage V sporulation protein D (sporulation-specific penicillin-binding protein)|uniref:Penicillin-binding protein, transpeptidase domain protein n=1 Tax=Eubacterium ramulus ATCC 29099 TaxID=1256908 RepID=U2PFI4_EUBRA|nr:penicillin-binding transpeptidase domain-containing protein [Eubacterium ramulus]ERK42926.1 penicillin-binding protein, transpeptidase domain protein [Eubacterium ramulus ATCC 29099]MBS5170704.1 peptidoglycan glycosyltransferase [Lachnospiraceae bacterium]